MAVADLVGGGSGLGARGAAWLARVGDLFAAERNRWPLWLPVFLGSSAAISDDICCLPATYEDAALARGG